MSGLAELFATASGASLGNAAEAVLGRHLAEARAAWPGIAVEPTDFVRHLGTRLGPDTTLDQLEHVRGADVYLALACARGDDGAIARFEDTYFQEIARAGSKSRAGDDIVNEVRSRLRRILFVAEGERPAAVAEFAGRGDLRGWLRVTATREVVHAIRRAGKHVAVGDDALFDVLSPGTDPELAYIRELYRAELQGAFADALGALSARQKSLLRYQLVDGLNIEAIGALHGVHRSTVARWITEARDLIAARTREELARRLGASEPEVDSIIRLVRSRLDVSLERMIGSDV